MDTTEFDRFIETAWNDHADDSAGVAQRLRDHIDQVDRMERVAPYGRLISHVFGEHLGDWGAGVALLAVLRSHPAARSSRP